MRDAQDDRSAVGVGVVAIGSLLSAAVLQLALRRPATHWPLTASLVLLGGFSGWRFVQLRRGQIRADTLTTSHVGILLGLVTLLGIAHMGPLSSLTMLLPALVFFSAQGDNRRNAAIEYLVCAVGYLALLALVIVGVLPLTRSLLPLERENPRAVLLLGLFAEGVLGATFLVGRATRRRTLQAMAQLDSARSAIDQGEALLDEARAELADARGAARLGRYSGRQVGPYLAQEIIGRGAMGDVYRAVHEVSGEPTALKVLHASLLEDATQTERFLREADFASHLDSPHIVRVRSVGHTGDGSPFIAMELLVGYDLSDLLRRQHRLQLQDVIALVTEVAEALTTAAGAGLVHRDIKPQNLFRTGSARGGTWKVLDFGISKAVGSGASLTRDHVIGTPAYMSPEQAMGLPVDPTSDVFSLGVVAYRALTGRPPFAGHDAVSVAFNVITSMPSRPSALVDVPGDVDRVFALVLAKEKGRRLSSARLFADALRDASNGQLSPAMRAAAVPLEAEYPWGTSGSL